MGQPSQAVQNPYMRAFNVVNGGSPEPAAPNGDAANLLALWVPGETSMIVMGVGSPQSPAGLSPPGVRITTDTHVHVTAKTPATTISLGAQGGENSECEGFSLYTAHEKTEHVLLAVDHKYENKMNEDIKGPLTVGVNLAASYKYENTLTQEVKLAANYEYKNTFTTKVTGAAQYLHENTLEFKSKDRSETVEGVWKAEITRDCKWGIGGELKWDVKGNAEIKGYADSSAWWQGSKAEKTYGATMGLFVGNKNEVTVGIMTDTKVGGILETTVAYKVTLNEAADCWKGPIEDKHKDLKKEVTKLKSEAGKLVKKDYDLVKKSVKAYLHDVGTIFSLK